MLKIKLSQVVANYKLSAVLSETHKFLCRKLENVYFLYRRLSWFVHLRNFFNIRNCGALFIVNVRQQSYICKDLCTDSYIAYNLNYR